MQNRAIHVEHNSVSAHGLQAAFVENKPRFVVALAIKVCEFEDKGVLIGLDFKSNTKYIPSFNLQ